MTQKKTYRLAQINRLLQEQIAELFLTEMQDDRLRELTVTEVRASRDLSTANVFITTPKQTDPANSLKAANRSAGYIRKVLYSRLHLKRIPELTFRFDESLDRAEKIYNTLEQLDLGPDEENSEIS